MNATSAIHDGCEVSNRSVAGHILHAIGNKSQNGKLLVHLLRQGNISQLEALELYRVHRLASRMSDLKKHGVTITPSMMVDPTGVRYVRYSLI